MGLEKDERWCDDSSECVDLKERALQRAEEFKRLGDTYTQRFGSRPKSGCDEDAQLLRDLVKEIERLEKAALPLTAPHLSNAKLLESGIPEPKCEEGCGGILRPKCLWEMGVACPRHRQRREWEIEIARAALSGGSDD